MPRASRPNPLARVLAAALGLAAVSVPVVGLAQSFFNNTDPTAILGSVTITGTPTVSVTNTVAIGGTVAVSGTVPTTLSGSPTVVAAQPAASPTDCSRNLDPVIGTAVQVVASGTTRQTLLLHNPTATNIGLSFTSTTPVIGANQTYTLAAGQTLPFPPAGLTTSGAVWAAGSAANQPLTCTRWN